MALDLLLLHPPSVYDFRQKTILYGPVSDLIPSSQVFEMYPLGFASIAEYLERAGYRVRIVNLAVRMLNDRRFNAETSIKRLKAPVFGIDLHWLVSAHGAIEIAKIVKRCHPQAKVVVGGLTASYFHRELITYPEIDFVIRGDSTEEPFRQLMNCIANRRRPEDVPNLVWRDERGEVHENPLSHVPADLDDFMNNYYANMVRSAMKYLDLVGYAPFNGWLNYPITAVPTCRGCNMNCVFCGGSAFAYRNICGRDRTAFRSPQAVACDVEQIQRFSRGPIFVLGDLRQPGEGYADELLDLLGRKQHKNQFIFEIFSPAPAELLHRIGRACPNFCLEISPESHDPEVRKASGKSYSNQELEQTLSDALAAGCGRLDVFFMIGLPKQTMHSVMNTIEYCDTLLQKFKADKRLALFIAPLAPFLDPGCLGFEQSEHYGYRILFRALEEYRQALVAPTWKHALNYETEWMTRDQIVNVTYEAMLRLNRVKARHGIISAELAGASEQRIMAARTMMAEIERMTAEGRSQELTRLKASIDKVNSALAPEKRLLKFPVGLPKLRFLRCLWSLATGR